MVASLGWVSFALVELGVPSWRVSRHVHHQRAGLIAVIFIVDVTGACGVTLCSPAVSPSHGAVTTSITGGITEPKFVRDLGHWWNRQVSGVITMLITVK